MLFCACLPLAHRQLLVEYLNREGKIFQRTRREGEKVTSALRTCTRYSTCVRVANRQQVKAFCCSDFVGTVDRVSLFLACILLQYVSCLVRTVCQIFVIFLAVEYAIWKLCSYRSSHLGKKREICESISAGGRRRKYFFLSLSDCPHICGVGLKL